jgi:FixJ family two-component response regulator
MSADEPTVLVVEDNPGVRHVIVALLRRATGLRVEDFGSAAKALEAARTRGYGIAVLDVDMAPMDGIVLAAELQSLRPGLPIVFLTGSITDDRARAEAMKPVAVLQKPRDVRAVADVVRRHVLRSETSG